MAIVQVNLRWPEPPVKSWKILLVQSFTADALADGNQHFQIREKMLELSSAMLSTVLSTLETV